MRNEWIIFDLIVEHCRARRLDPTLPPPRDPPPADRGLKLPMAKHASKP